MSIKNKVTGELSNITTYDPVTGVISAISVSGNVTGNYILGDGGLLSNSATGGNGTPSGPVNSIQYNAGSGAFGGTANLVINPVSGNITATGNIVAAYLYGDGGNITNLPLANNTSKLVISV